MYRLTSLFFACVCVAFLGLIANAALIEVPSKQRGPKSYESYSYTLMDEIRISLKNDYGRIVAKTSSRTNKQPNPTNSSLKARNFIDFSIYAPIFQDILGVYSFDSNLDTQNQYTLGNFSARLDYLIDREKQGKIPAATLHIDYNLAPGISPYIETTHFRGTSSVDESLSHRRHKRSTLFLIGTKIEF
jgi:hypothetical protein